jgi:uncharacterized protein (DUF302 family)
MSDIPQNTSPAYALTTTLSGVSWSDAVPLVRRALAVEGFGVLTEIDIKATLKAKLDADVRDYIILGACNPKLAHRALAAEPGIGVLLPCNVVVTTNGVGDVVVAAVDPVAMFSIVGRPDIEPIAQEVRSKLERVLEALEGLAHRSDE